MCSACSCNVMILNNFFKISKILNCISVDEKFIYNGYINSELLKIITKKGNIHQDGNTYYILVIKSKKPREVETVLFFVKKLNFFLNLSYSNGCRCSHD